MSTRTEFSLPRRSGVKPETGPSVPHLQHSQTSPPEYVDALMAWGARNLHDVRETPTRISVPTTRAFWLDESVPAAALDGFMPPPGSREFAHVHADGSMHLCLSAEDIEEILANGWGELHPLKNQGVNEILFYAPRDESELELAKEALVRAWKYASGSALEIKP